MKAKVFLTLVITSLIVIVIINACSKSSGYSAQPPTTTGNVTTISITGMAFPATVTVTKGATVKWNNNDGMAHTVTSDDGTSFNSGNLASGGSFSYVAATAGSFSYHCNIHSGMTGTLVVNP